MPLSRPRLRPLLRPLLIALAGALLVLVPAACDFPGPAVTVAFTSHSDGQRIVGSRTVTVSGVLHGVTPTSFKLTLNGKDVPLALPTSGTFSAPVTLDRDGTNTLIATATASGETSTATLHLYYPYLSFTDGEAATVVMGQTSFTASSAQASIQHLDHPVGAPALVGGKLYIPDTGNHRVVGFGTVPSGSGALFSILLGKLPGQWTDGGSPASTQRTTLSGPAGVASVHGGLAIADTGNSRVLLWTGAPSTSSSLASSVLGQPGFTTSTPNCQAAYLDHPRAVISVAGRIIVADTGNNRILVWNDTSPTSGTAANLVLGQTSFTSCGANAGTTRSATTLASPGAVWSDGTRLVVADTANHRVLIWTSFPTSNGQAANFVLGQSTMAAATPADGTDGLSSPSSVTSNGNQLFVADTGNHRVLVYSGFPTADHEPAKRVLGQADFTNTDPNRTTGTAADTLSSPQGVQVYDGMLMVADTGNSRELIYKP